MEQTIGSFNNPHGEITGNGLDNQALKSKVSRTKIYLFYTKDQSPVVPNLNGITIPLPPKRGGKFFLKGMKILLNGIGSGRLEVV